MLVKMHAEVHVLMTQNATQFINPITFETLVGHKCLIDTFDRNFQYSVEHVALAKKADIVLVAPASANVIGKIANGIADDMLTTTVMACPCKKLIAPAMNTRMFENPILQDNLEKCRHYGMDIIMPDSGRLACGDVGSGKLPSEEVLVAAILKEIRYEKDMQGLKVLVTAGATQEAIDPVRFISNHSTGKMGFALAKTAMQRGADVTVVAAHTSAKEPLYVNIRRVSSAADMFEACKEAGRTVFMRFFHGNRAYAGKFREKAGEEKSGYDRSEQPESKRRRLCDGHQRCDTDHKRRGQRASADEQG